MAGVGILFCVVRSQELFMVELEKLSKANALTLFGFDESWFIDPLARFLTHVETRRTVYVVSHPVLGERGLIESFSFFILRLVLLGDATDDRC